MRSCARFLIVLVMVLTHTNTTSATTIIPMAPEEIVIASDIIFSGTVSDVRSVWVPHHETIVTRITFSNLTYMKGDRTEPRIVLTFLGGKVGRDEIWVDGAVMPSLGRRYVVAATKDLGSEKNSYMPVVGLFQGLFEVVKDASGERVLHWTGLPIVELENDAFVLFDPALPSSGSKGTQVFHFGPDDERPVPTIPPSRTGGLAPDQVKRPRVQGSPNATARSRIGRVVPEPQHHIQPKGTNSFKIVKSLTAGRKILPETDFVSALKRIVSFNR